MTKSKLHPLGLRMNKTHIDKLDRLCKTNMRSRREIVEILVDRETAALKTDKDRRINP